MKNQNSCKISTKKVGRLNFQFFPKNSLKFFFLPHTYNFHAISYIL